MMLMFFDYFSPIFIAMMPAIVFATLMMPPRRLTDAFTPFHADLPVFQHEGFFASRRRRFAMMPLFAHRSFSPAIFFSIFRHDSAGMRRLSRFFLRSFRAFSLRRMMPRYLPQLCLRRFFAAAIRPIIRFCRLALMLAAFDFAAASPRHLCFSCASRQAAAAAAAMLSHYFRRRAAADFHISTPLLIFRAADIRRQILLTPSAVLFDIFRCFSPTPSRCALAPRAPHAT
jgi:hypothetical protein